MPELVSGQVCRKAKQNVQCVTLCACVSALARGKDQEHEGPTDPATMAFSGVCVCVCVFVVCVCVLFKSTLTCFDQFETPDCPSIRVFAFSLCLCLCACFYCVSLCALLSVSVSVCLRVSLCVCLCVCVCV